MNKYSVYLVSNATDEIVVEADTEDEAAEIALNETDIEDPTVESVQEI